MWGRQLRPDASMMFVSGENDGYGAAAVARQLYKSAPGPKELQIVDSQLVTRLAAFVTRHR